MKNSNLHSASLWALCIFFLSPFYLSSQNYVRVVDPKQTWRSTTPAITEATISIRPRGLYIEYGVYLTYSAQQTSYNTVRDTLEVQHYFNLPQGSAVNDSWLWVDNFIMKALLWDRISATSVYEGIVKRRQDPSILYKNSPTSYEFRIFPMVGNQTRRVKLNFFVPAKWSPTQLTAELPLSMIQTSSTMPNVNLIVYESSDWKTPSVDFAPNTTWSTVTDSIFGTSKRTTLSGISKSAIANISYKSYEDKSFFFSNTPVLGTTDEGHYQLAFAPKTLLNDTTSSPKKLLFLVDYESSNTSFTAQQALNLVKKNVYESLSRRDSFNVFYNRLTTRKVNNKWVVADSANIERAFSTMNDPSVGIGNSSILTSLVAEGYDFIKTQRGGEVVLISSNDAFSTLASVQSLYSDLERQYRPLPITHAFDFASRILVGSVWNQNRYYYGNELLYSVITSNTRGNFSNMTSLSPTLSEFEKAASDFFLQLTPLSPIDVTIKPAVGLTYERYNLQNNSANQPFIQIGKYKGNFPITVDITTTNTLNQLITGKLVLQANPTATTDSSNRQLHAANKIQTLEASPVPLSNSLISRIIQESKDNRILSRYTAFIALEPSLQTPCDTCRDETGGVRTATKDIQNDSIKVTVYPNPFKDVVKIDIEKPATSKISNALITNLLGQTIKVFTPQEMTGDDKKVSLTWNDDTASAGTYIFSTMVNGKRYVHKLVKIQE